MPGALKDLLTRLLRYDVSAEILDEILRPEISGSFRAFLRGARENDLRFYVVPQGAVPELSTEEVAVLNLTPNGDRRGIWYSSHLEKEWKDGTASADEEKRTFAAEHYVLDVNIQGNREMKSTTDIRLKALADGAGWRIPLIV